jgi:hypothetical protein
VCVIVIEGSKRVCNCAEIRRVHRQCRRRATWQISSWARSLAEMTSRTAFWVSHPSEG